MNRSQSAWAFGIAMLCAASGAAQAMECSKPQGQLNKVICSDKPLRQAEEAMSRTYFRVLAKAPDKEAHDLLQEYQKRWVGSRESAWGGDPGEDDPYEMEDDELARFLIEETKSRIGHIHTFYDDLARERAAVSEFVGGPYSGASVTCERAPKGFGNGSYFCTGYLSLQNKDRVCTREIGWASGHDLSARTVQKVTKDGLVGVATCNEGYASGRACPNAGGDDKDAGWETDTGLGERAQAGDAPGKAPLKLPRFAPDLGSFADEMGWMRECLTAEVYPDPKLVRQPSR